MVNFLRSTNYEGLVIYSSAEGTGVWKGLRRDLFLEEGTVSIFENS